MFQSGRRLTSGLFMCYFLIYIKVKSFNFDVDQVVCFLVEMSHKISCRF